MNILFEPLIKIELKNYKFNIYLVNIRKTNAFDKQIFQCLSEPKASLRKKKVSLNVLKQFKASKGVKRTLLFN